MRYRVREGKRYRGSGPGEVVDEEPHRAALVPWCLEELAPGKQRGRKPKSRQAEPEEPQDAPAAEAPAAEPEGDGWSPAGGWGT